MALAIAPPLLIFNTLNFREIVAKQGFYYAKFIPNWGIFHSPSQGS